MTREECLAWVDAALANEFVRLATYPYGSPAIAFWRRAAMPAMRGDGESTATEETLPKDPAHAAVVAERTTLRCFPS